MRNKKLIFTALALLSASAYAQPKPNINKASAALLAKNLSEAKAIIDATVGSQDFMTNKKGEPSKNAAKAWYLKGVIYAAIDTSKNAETHNLASNAFETSKEAFEKSHALDNKTASFISDASGFPLTIAQVKANLAQGYINKSVSAYQKDEPDPEKKKQLYKTAFAEMEKAVALLPNDTSQLMNAGVYMGPQADEYQKSLQYIDRYIKAGGKSSDAYIQQYSLYRDKLNDPDKALQVAQEMVKKFPTNKEFPRYELDMYVKMKKFPEALEMMTKQAAANPKDKESRYYAGLVCEEMKDPADAQKWYKEAILVDPDYYEPNASIAQAKYNEARAVKEERNNITGNSPADLKKRADLYQTTKIKLEEALVFYRKLESLKPNEDAILYGLLSIYGDLHVYDEKKYLSQVNQLKAKMKGLGLEVD